jgi:DNA-binding NtrC family response regulator
VLDALAEYAWPGNVRELANLCASLAVRGRANGAITLDELEQVWRRQYAGETAPWKSSAARRGPLGDWVLEQARAARFNLVECARLLQKRSRAGQRTPVSERSALAYYLTGEIVRALASAGGDARSAARAIAGDEDLTERVQGRVDKVVESLRAIRSRDSLRARFAKLPAEYGAALERAHRLVAER